MQLAALRVETASGGSWRRLVAVDAVDAGTPLFLFEGKELSYNSSHSLQIGEELHLHGDPDDPGEALNHACEPNARIDVATRTLIALRPIAAGEEVMFNYLTTELDFRAPFHCRCGAPRCFGLIRGYRHLSDADRARVDPLAAPFLRARLGRP